jgi:hypothetical protein
MDSQTAQVGELLHEAAETHHRVYRIVDGADDDWASWYGDWLVRLSELPQVLGKPPVRSELVYLLVRLDKEYVARKPEEGLGDLLRESDRAALLQPRTGGRLSRSACATVDHGMRINRTQALVLGLGLAAWLSLIGVLIAAPNLAGAPKLSSGDSRLVKLAFLVTVTAFLCLLGVGVVRRWRWTFWLILVAFLAGALRVPATALQLVGVLPASGPTWDVLVQAAIGLVQFAIGLVMVSGLRRTGAWRPSAPHRQAGLASA